MEKIKVCPFCGKEPVLSKYIYLVDERNRGSMEPTHDLEVSWRIKCNNCGTEKNAYGRTYYDITKDGELVIVPQNYGEEEKKNPSDKRLEVIEMWNKRFE